MIAFADASVIGTFYAAESDHELLRSLPDMLVTSVSRVDVVAALRCRARNAEICAAVAAVAVQGFVFEVSYGPVHSSPSIGSWAAQPLVNA